MSSIGPFRTQYDEIWVLDEYNGAEDMPVQDQISDSWLVRRALSGRRESFDRLVERHIGAVYAVALSRTRNHADAEDVVQDAFIRAYTGLDKLREPRKFSSWVVTIARNGASHVLVRQKREADSLRDDRAASVASVPDPSQAELHAILRDQVNDLDADGREVLLMHYFAGYSAREISARLDISRDAALKRLQRAREKLAGAILQKLEGALEDRQGDIKKRTARISSAIAAVSVPWSSRKAAAFAMRPAALLVGTVGTGVALIAFLLWPNANEEGAAPASKQPVAMALDNNVVVQDRVVEAASGPPLEMVEEVVESVPVAMQSEDTLPTLDGLWTLHQPKDTSGWPEGHDWPVSATVELTQRENEITMLKVLPASSGRGSAEGTLEDGEIVFPLLDVFGIMVGGTPSADQVAVNPTMTGNVHPSNTRIRLEGILPEYGAPANTPAMPFVVVMNRLRDDDAFTERALQQHVATAQEIRDAILAYAYDHQGRLPRTLADLVSRYIDDLSMVTDNEQRSFIYEPDAMDIMSAVWSTSDWAGYRPDLSAKERVIAWEEERVAAYGDQFLDAADLFRVRVGTTNVEVYARFHGDPKIVDPDRVTLGQPNATVDVVRSARAQADACMLRLKEAGLGIVWFWGTTDEQFNPAGWHSLVPEYIGDPSLLTCPSHGRGTLSYAMTFPAMSRSELTAIYADLRGADPASVSAEEVGQGMPLAIETIPHVIDGREFRAALFLDGHVGMFHDRDWARYVEPYMSYAME